MAFGQSSGPPATGKQMRELEELLELAGHTDFRDARGPMGFTQRQAGGKFTRDEAEAFIEQLEAEVHGDGPPPDPEPVYQKARPKAAKPVARAVTPIPKSVKPVAKSTKHVRPITKTPSGDPALADISDEVLAAELQSRGWIVVEP